jgi:hypothetical protein
MKRYTGPEIFFQCEVQGRRVLGLYETYRAMPRFPNEPGLTQQQVAQVIVASLLTVALCFTMQAEVYVNQGLMKAILDTRWLVGVIVVLAAGFVCSVIISELLPGTRLLTASIDNPVRSGVDALMDKLKGVRRKGRSTLDLLRAYGVGFVVLMFLFITFCSAYHAIKSGNWLQGIFPPLLFILDSLFGVGPVWLVTFVFNRFRVRGQNRRAEAQYQELEAAWNLVAELYNAGRERFFEEHPDLDGKPDKLPPVSPLAAYIITNPCFREVEIAEHLFRAAAASPPPQPKPAEKDTAEDPIEEAGPMFSAMDSDSEANNEKI